MPNRQSLRRMADDLGKLNASFDEICDDDQINQYAMSMLRTKCLQLKFQANEIPSRISFVKDQWTQDNHMLTAAFKLKRRSVYDFYSKKIEQIFEEI